MKRHQWLARKKAGQRGDPLKPATMDLSPEFAERLRKLAKRVGHSQGAVVETLSIEAEPELGNQQDQAAA